MTFESIFFCFMEFQKITFNFTALYYAIRNGNTELVRLLLTNKDIDINIKYILKSRIIFMKFKTNFFFLSN